MGKKAAESLRTPNASASGGRHDRRSENIPYLAGIDHLRCAAALLIVYFHGLQTFLRHSGQHWRPQSNPVLALIAEGHTAVSLFMVLSGFIFAFGTSSKRIVYRKFLANRFFRTYPLFVFLVIAGSAVYPSAIRALPLAQTLLGGANLRGAQDLKHFSAVFWAVAVEWQFYLIFPALMASVDRNGIGQLWRLLGLVFVCRWIGHLMGMMPVDALYGHLFGRLDQFVLGMVAGILYRGEASRRAFRWTFAPALLAVFVGAFAFNHLGGWPRQHWLKLITPTLEGVIWAAVIGGYLAVLERAALLREAWLSRMVAAVGATSYSIYLWHFMFLQIQHSRGWVLHFVEHPELDVLLLVSVTTLPVLLLFSCLTYHAIEKPFMALRTSYVAPDHVPSLAPAERRAASPGCDGSAGKRPEAAEAS
jgi:peptidoglycan/LPS O-acetylase OafA/YrhL